MSVTSTNKPGEQNPITLENDAEVHGKSARTRRSNSFLKYVLKKFVYYAAAFFIAVSITFILPRLMPNQLEFIISTNLGPQDPLYQQRLALLEAYFRIDKSPLEGLLDFWIAFFRGDLGPSLILFPTLVTDVIAARLPYTLAIVLPALFASFFLGNWVGSRIGFSKGRKNTVIFYLLVALQSVPFYWFSLIILDFLGFRLHMSTGGIVPPFAWENFFDLLYIGSLPFLTLLICTTGGWATGMRAMTIYEMNSGYILFCEKLGFRKHKLQSTVQRNAILPQITGLNLRFSEFIGSTVVLEAVFGWPGLGSTMLYAFQHTDYTLIMGCFLVTIFIILVGNFLIDIAYGFLDPRIKTGGQG